jgi:hypothetical protein
MPKNKYADYVDENIIHTTDSNGVQKWRKNGDLHRVNGPAVIYPCGSEEWYQDGELHREDGPAVIINENYKRSLNHADWQTGIILYYRHGERHRLDGPAMITQDGSKFYYISFHTEDEGSYIDTINKLKAVMPEKFDGVAELTSDDKEQEPSSYNKLEI